MFPLIPQSLVASWLQNLIPHGDFAKNPHQEGDSFTGLSDGDYVADLIKWKQSGTMVVDYSNPAGSTTNSKAARFTVTTGDAAMAVSDHAHIEIPLEGNDIAHLGFGASGASNFAVAFKVQSDVTGIFTCALQNSAGDRAYIGELNIAAADVPQLKTIIFEGDETGTWLADENTGFNLIICLAAGTDHHGTADTWLATGDFSTVNQVNFVATTNYFQIEVLRGYEGDIDLGPHYPSKPQVLAHCKYYIRQYNADASADRFMAGIMQTATIAELPIQIDGGMRIEPAFSMSAAAHWTVVNPTTKTVSAWTKVSGTKEWLYTTATVATGATPGFAAVLRAASSSAWFKLDARL